MSAPVRPVAHEQPGPGLAVVQPAGNDRPAAGESSASMAGDTTMTRRSWRVGPLLVLSSMSIFSLALLPTFATAAAKDMTVHGRAPVGAFGIDTLEHVEGAAKVGMTLIRIIPASWMPRRGARCGSS